MMTDELTARVAGELEVRNAISRIAILADQGDLDEYIDQFTEEAVWGFPGGVRTGRADILAGAVERRAGGVTGPGSNTRHVITTVAVTVEGPDSASGDSYFLFYQNTTTAPTLFNMGWYHDAFTREGDRWRLARRDITLG
jgi:3-phenylpropionate/cinnamic acid dioxygenase small subunit